LRRVKATREAKLRRDLETVMVLRLFRNRSSRKKLNY
jgi:hypothetical protein